MDDGGKRRVDSLRATANGKDDKVIDQIMLRFRPIAPRPATAESSGYMLPTSDLNRKRVKRKYVRVKKKINKARDCTDNKNWLKSDVAMIGEYSDGNKLVVTDPVNKPSNWISFDSPENNRSKRTVNHLLTSEPPEKPPSDLHGVDPATAVRRSKVSESWITIESVTGACEDRRMIGFSDDEIWKHLETDSSPGFISNGYDEVLWVNPAYRMMLDLKSDGGAPASAVVVWLVVKVEKSTVVQYLPAFSCRVRIEYRLCEKKRKMMVPCDVCKMDSGGFAWLLDVRFALSLGPLNG